MDLSPSALLRLSFDSATVDLVDVPSGLEARVLAAAISGEGQAVQHPAWRESATFTPLDAFITTAANLAELLDSLAGEDWRRPTRIEGATVRNVVEHLVGVERYLLGQLGRRSRIDAPRREDHWPATTLAAADLASEPDDVVARTWWREVLDLIAACSELGPDVDLAFHQLAGSIRGLLVVRTFELWTHADDIRDAIGQPRDLLDERRLSLMARELMTVLPFGLALSGCPQPGRTARLQVTGMGGGSFDVPLGVGEPIGQPDVTLTVDVIELCRLAANRLARDVIDVVVEGDRGLLEPILVGAAAFASD